MRVLVTGATGYIGGRLVPRLLQAGHTVRVLVRDPNRVAGRPWADQVDIRSGDLLEPRSLSRVFDDIDVAYYLVHSMYAGGDFAQLERQAALNFCRAATQLRHVVYLGGLMPQSARVSAHLYSRADVGRNLAWHVPTTELRAGPIIGSGSASFEMVRYLTERLPVMIAPRWVLNKVQPIAVRALQRIEEQAVETHWTGALGDAPTYELRDSEGLVEEVRTLHVDVPPELAFRQFASLGGDRGWLVWRWAWWVRGMLDRVVGGPGLRRGRRHPQELLPGEAVDFWRVEAVEPPCLLRLRAEMKLPGRGWLQWEATPEASGTRLIQTAAFAPRGLFGTLYWHMLYPFHRLIFTRLVNAIADNAVGSKNPADIETP